MSAEKRLEELGIELPAAATPIGNYVTTVQTGNLIFTSGHGPGRGEGSLYSGPGGHGSNDRGRVCLRTAGRLVPARDAPECARQFGSGQAGREGGWIRQFGPEFHGATVGGQWGIGLAGGSVRR